MKNENLEKKLDPDSKPERGEKLKRIIKKIMKRTIYNTSINLLIKKKFNELVVEGKENIPKDDYVIFAGNHSKLVDPLIFYYLVENIPMIARDDFLDGLPFKPKIFGNGRDLNSLLNDFLSWEFDSVPIRRGGIKLSQTKECIKKFEENKKICFFPMGTRTISGSIHDTYEGSDKRNPGKLVYILQRNVGKPVNIVPFSLSYDEIAKIVTLTIGKSCNINKINLKGLPQGEQNIFYEKIMDDMICNIGNLTKVYGDSILATIIKSATTELEEKEFLLCINKGSPMDVLMKYLAFNLEEKKCGYYIKKDPLMEVFNSVVEKLNLNKEINLDKKLLGQWYKWDYLNKFFGWAEKKTQFVGMDFNKGYLLFLDNIRKEPRKRLLKEDVNTLYLNNKSEHLTLLQKVVIEELSKNKDPLIYPERVY